MFPSRLHLPVPLGSTVVTRFLATTGTLTPAPLLPAPKQVSLIHEPALPDIPSPSTPCAPVSRPCSLLRAGLAPDSLAWAIGGSSDFALYSQSRQSHLAVSSSCRGASGPAVLRTIRSLPVALHLVSPRRSYFQLLGRKLRPRGTLTLCARSLSSAHRGRDGACAPPLPPNRTGGFPASGSPVSGLGLEHGSLVSGLRLRRLARVWRSKRRASGDGHDRLYVASLCVVGAEFDAGVAVSSHPLA